MATFESGDTGGPAAGSGNGVAWEPSRPTVAVETELLSAHEYEVRVFDVERDRRLVAAVEIVSPANKDRPEHRQAFVGKCEALLRKGVSVCIIDLVTSRHFNLYTELLELGLRGPVSDLQRRDLQRIRLNQEHLLSLIGGVLDLTRIESGRVSYELTPVDVSARISSSATFTRAATNVPDGPNGSRQ